MKSINVNPRRDSADLQLIMLDCYYVSDNILWAVKEAMMGLRQLKIWFYGAESSGDI